MTDKPEFKMPLWMLDQYDASDTPLLDAIRQHRLDHPELYPVMKRTLCGRVRRAVGDARYKIGCRIAGIDPADDDW